MDCGLYVHFPWCASRCTYCDFNTYVVDRIPSARYTEAILREGATRSPAFSDHRLTTIYFGGGTPSLWAADGIGAVIDAAARWFPVRGDLEITMECNPAEATPDRLAAARDTGVNRLSLGVQSFDDAILAALGRRHDADTARVALDHALSAGFDSVSADLIFGLPDQTLSAWTSDLKTLCATGVPHLSVYHLTLEPGTAMTRDVEAGKIELPDDDVQADMWEAIVPTIGAWGLELYEISSAARPGHRARHNTHYWTGRPYLGLGAGAHSMRPPKAWSDTATVTRALNTKHHLTYLTRVEADGAAVGETEILDRQTHLRERLFTGLRRLDGLDLAALEHELALDPRTVIDVDDLTGRGLLELDGPTARLSARGLRYANDVFLTFF